MLSPAELEVAGVAAGCLAAAWLAVALGRREASRAWQRPARLALVAALLFVAGYVAIALAKLDAYNMGAEDLGRVDQAVWSVLGGKPLVFSASEIGRPMSRMAGHVELLYIPLAPLFLLWDSAGALLVAQAVLVALGAWPAFNLGRALGGNALAAASAIAWLAHPAVGFATLADIHGDTLAMPFLLLALERAWAGRRLSAFVAMALAVAGKEYVAALAITAAALIWFLRRERRLAIAWAALGLAWLLLVVPALHHRHRPPDFPKLTPLYYKKLGTTPREVVVTALRRPDRVLAEMATPRKLGVTAMLLAPLGWAALASPLPLLAAAPVFVPLAVSEQLDLRNHHNATLLPFLLLASLLGARRLAGDRAHLVLLAATAVAHLTIAPSPWSVRSWTPGRWDYLGNPHLAGRTGHHDVLDQAVAMVPRAARVTASGNIVPQLSHREVCFTFPGPRALDAVDVAVVDLAGAWPPAWRPRASEIEGLRRLLSDPGFTLRFARDGVFVVARDGIELVGSGSTAPAGMPCAPAPSAARMGQAIALGPLRMQATGPDLLWRPVRAIVSPLLVLDSESREVWLGPSAPLGPLEWPGGDTAAAQPDCWPPRGRRLRVLELREGFPALEWPSPPQPWLPDPALGERQF